MRRNRSLGDVQLADFHDDAYLESQADDASTNAELLSTVFRDKAAQDQAKPRTIHMSDPWTVHGGDAFQFFEFEADSRSLAFIDIKNDDVEQTRKFERSNFVPLPLASDLVFHPARKGLLRFEDLSLRNQIGLGDFATVSGGTYRGQEIAVKVAKEEETKGSRELEMFCNEIYILQTLVHPNIVNLVGYGCLKQGPSSKERMQLSSTNPLETMRPFLVQPLCYPIVNVLRKWRREGARSPRQRLQLGIRVALELAEALEAVHNAQLLHRDIKISNILVSPDGHVKLCDFGLSCGCGPGDHRLDTSKTIEPSILQYKAPELLARAPSGRPADVYAYGVTINIVMRLLVGTGMVCKMLNVTKFIGSLFCQPACLPPKIAAALIFSTTVGSGWPRPLKHLISQCGSLDEERRPPFCEIVADLESMQTQAKVQEVQMKARRSLSEISVCQV